jgi:hypothetical protein
VRWRLALRGPVAVNAAVKCRVITDEIGCLSHPVAVVPPLAVRAGTRASRWSAPPDERAGRPGPGVLGGARDVGGGVASIPEPEAPAEGDALDLHKVRPGCARPMPSGGRQQAAARAGRWRRVSAALILSTGVFGSSWPMGRRGRRSPGLSIGRASRVRGRARG